MPCNTPPPPSFDEIADGAPIPAIVEMQDDGIDDDDIIEIADMEDDDDSDLTFVAHGDSVFCCNFDGSGNLAVSGGQDEKPLVWDTNTGDTKLQCIGHRDSVIAADFNYDSSLVATAGMDGVIQVWNVASGEKIWNYEISEITWMTWHPSENILFAGTVDGDCFKWSVDDSNQCDIFPTHGSGSTCGKLFSNGEKCAVGYVDGSVRVWDTNSHSVIASATGKDAHLANVISLSCSADGNLIVTGSEDGTAKLIRSSNCKVLHTWTCTAAGGEEKESVESVGFFTSHPLVATATNSGNLRIFDISTYAQRATVCTTDAIVKVICSDTSPFVYIATRGEILLYDARNAELHRKWEGHGSAILDFAISKNGDKLLTASDDYYCKIFKL